jgi:ribosomal protein S12 methylthiotransferase accessory factor
MVFMPYSFDLQHGEVAIAQRISTGLACHGTFEEAAVSAICEVIERDGFSITWQACLSRPKIRLDTLSDQNRDLVQRFQKVGDSVTLLNITMDHGVPTVLGVLCGRHIEAPALVVSASASLDPENAVRKALEELAHTRRLAQHLRKSQSGFVPPPNYADVLTQDDHVSLYTDPANMHLANFLLASTAQIDFNDIADLSTGDPHEDLRVLVERVEAVRHRVLITDLTSEDLQERGLKVVRALIPGFHPLFMRYQFRALGGSRLWEVPQKLGYEGITPESGDNPAPHPFP